MLIFGLWVIVGFFSYIFFLVFSGECFVKEIMLFVGKVGEKIVSEVIMFYDDLFYLFFFRLIIVDDEGVLIRKNVFVENGVFKGFVWDNYWVKIYGIESIGNGKRDIRSGGINIGFYSVVIENGKCFFEDIIGEIDRGYFVDGF